MNKTAEKTIPFGAAHTYVAHIREYPPPPTPGAFIDFSCRKIKPNMNRLAFAFCPKSFETHYHILLSDLRLRNRN